MPEQRHDPASGVHGEKVQDARPEYRARRPGTVIHVRTTVTVEYNDYNGLGPYTVDYDIHDLERAFKPQCEARVLYSDGEGPCRAYVNFRGDCPRAYLHIKPRCEANARKGTRTGMCDTVLDEHGNCPNAGSHIE
jgi:hypothetical protein